MENGLNEKLEDNENLSKEIEKYDSGWTKKSEVLVKGHGGYVVALKLWFFRFFNYRRRLVHSDAIFFLFFAVW